MFVRALLVGLSFLSAGLTGTLVGRAASGGVATEPTGYADYAVTYSRLVSQCLQFGWECHYALWRSAGTSHNAFANGEWYGTCETHGTMPDGSTWDGPISSWTGGMGTGYLCAGVNVGQGGAGLGGFWVYDHEVGPTPATTGDAQGRTTRVEAKAFDLNDGQTRLHATSAFVVDDFTGMTLLYHDDEHRSEFLVYGHPPDLPVDWGPESVATYEIRLVSTDVFPWKDVPLAIPHDVTPAGSATPPPPPDVTPPDPCAALPSNTYTSITHNAEEITDAAYCGAGLDDAYKQDLTQLQEEQAPSWQAVDDLRDYTLLVLGTLSVFIPTGPFEAVAINALDGLEASGWGKLGLSALKHHVETVPAPVGPWLLKATVRQVVRDETTKYVASHLKSGITQPMVDATLHELDVDPDIIAQYGADAKFRASVINNIIKSDSATEFLTSEARTLLTGEIDAMLVHVARTVL